MCWRKRKPRHLWSTKITKVTETVCRCSVRSHADLLYQLKDAFSVWQSPKQHGQHYIDITKHSFVDSFRNRMKTLSHYQHPLPLIWAYNFCWKKMSLLHRLSREQKNIFVSWTSQQCETWEAWEVGPNRSWNKKKKQLTLLKIPCLYQYRDIHFNKATLKGFIPHC